MLKYRALLATASALLVLGIFAVLSVQAARIDRTLEPSYDIESPPAAGATPAGEPPPQLAPAASAPSTLAGVPQVDSEWVRRTALAAGIPEPALRSYGRASLMAPASCHLGWTTLAGIGWVESEHGTLDGRTLSEQGYSSDVILGPALDGRGDVAAIPATANGTRWHGDSRWEHAVGPMQFIPSTWDDWASDGDGDGVEDPHDIDDAAYAAARYLCADGLDLAAGSGWATAVWSYNHSQAYVDSVHHAATVYGERTD